MIKKKGNKFQLISKSTGKVLGTHDTRKQAVAQERAIKASQARKR